MIDINLFLRKRDINQLYKYVVDDEEKWPIFRYNKKRNQVIQLVKKYTLKHFIENNSENIHELIAECLYLEQIRIKEQPWRVDPSDEKEFWKDVKYKLKEIKNKSVLGESTKQLEEELLLKIIDRYAQEIAGNFKISTYRIATILVPFVLTKIFNASIRIRNRKEYHLHKNKSYSLNDKVKVIGDIELIRKLSTKGTILLLPTHFSNLDSIVMGWTIRTIGLSPFMYGAGLNLFNMHLFAYFMGRLGAYKVDRRKKNQIYLEALKTYTKISIDYGVHQLFFPGGTRSRSGSIEKKLKLGLLSTAIDVQCENCRKNPDNPRKIFVVPAVINYHFVLDAASLIHQELKNIGKEKYLTIKDKSGSTWNILKTIVKFFTASSDMIISYGAPMDVFGNRVDENGVSYDKHNRPIRLFDYFSFNDKFLLDEQRNSQYTIELGDRILKEFLRTNVVMTSHLVAFTAFEMIKNQFKLSLFDLLSVPTEEISLEMEDFVFTIEKTKSKILELYQKSELKISEELNSSTNDLITHGLYNLGLYNEKKPLMINKEGKLVTQDLALLYYYHNRLDGYGLEKLFHI
ncbi:MAG: 1-acyl-sn-glycerol-3-phosphate acyltransferase [Flavobacteriales bacterium]|nr:1-acyl-sn-glycerol-3-phosphate acyltransferase [Flavobacteriales bacterium]